jgi:hypothetical protein
MFVLRSTHEAKITKIETELRKERNLVTTSLAEKNALMADGGIDRAKEELYAKRDEYDKNLKEIYDERNEIAKKQQEAEKVNVENEVLKAKIEALTDKVRQQAKEIALLKADKVA